mmetsp:Transcript_26892/g.65344  ORF Transcript_26892/g.65344 Transcript_26892/m.65344 type:complete len:238 (+) Transcript_26892:1670-2383(+)
MRRYMRSAALKRHTRAALLCSSGRIRPIVPATLKINSDTWMGDWRKRPTVPKWIKATNMSARKAAWHAVYRALEETTSSGGEFQTSLRSETDWMMMTTEVTCRRKVELFSRNLWRYMRAAFQQKPALTPSSEDARDVSRFSLSLRCVLPLNTLSARAVASFSPSSSSSSSSSFSSISQYFVSVRLKVSVMTATNRPTMRNVLRIEMRMKRGQIIGTAAGSLSSIVCSTSYILSGREV